MRLTCETCDADATGTWRVNGGRPTICCDDCNPSSQSRSAGSLPSGFSYIRWFPLPKDISEDWLLDFVAPEVLAEAYAK